MMTLHLVDASLSAAAGLEGSRGDFGGVPPIGVGSPDDTGVQLRSAMAPGTSGWGITASPVCLLMIGRALECLPTTIDVEDGALTPTAAGGSPCGRPALASV